MSTATGKDIHAVIMDVEAIAVIKKNRKKSYERCVKFETGHKIISGNKRTRKQVENIEAEE